MFLSGVCVFFLVFLGLCGLWVCGFGVVGAVCGLGAELAALWFV